MTAEEFATQVNNGTAPWINNDWSDSTKEQYFNLLNTDTANAMELDRWRLNNEYNSPRNQMIRMIEAGISPAFAYQQLSSGNSSSVPGTHKADATRFHDTQDKLDTINTIMQGITSVMGTISQGISAANGIKDMHLAYQNNWFDKLRADNLNDLYIANSLDAFYNRYGNDRVPYEIAPGIYAPANMIGLYKDLLGVNGFSSMAQDLAVKKGNLNIQQQLADRRTRIDGLIQNIFKGLESNASSEEMLRMFMELFVYGMMSKFGGY